MSPTLSIRRATESDLPLVVSFIRELAEYEELAHEVHATESDLRNSLFGKNPAAEVVFAYANETPVGFAVFFHNFSTFLGKSGIYLEDIFVRPEARRSGVGKALLAYLARVAIERGCGRLEWAVLDWNTLALDFYRALGSVPMDDWTIHRITGDALDRLASTRE